MLLLAFCELLPTKALPASWLAICRGKGGLSSGRCYGSGFKFAGNSSKSVHKNLLFCGLQPCGRLLHSPTVSLIQISRYFRCEW